MPRLIRDGAIQEDGWLAAAEGAATDGDNQICTLEQWLALADKAGSAVQLEPGDGVEALLPHLDELVLVAVNFPAFTDGRGFSYGRELRERGFTGELRAVGAFIRDQLTFLTRVGFNAFQFADETELEGACDSLQDFTEHYQAATDQPLPLFRRRS